MRETYTPDQIREDEYFQECIAREPLCAMDDFIRTLPPLVEVMEAISLEQDYRDSVRKAEAERLIREYGEIGLELVDSDGRLAVVLPEPSQRGGLRLSFYDENGPANHNMYSTPCEAVVDAIKGGYRTPAPGRLDALTDLPSWRRGVNFVNLLLKHNGNAMQFLNDNPGYLDS